MDVAHHHNHDQQQQQQQNVTELIVSLYTISSYDRFFISLCYYLISMASVLGNSMIILAIGLNKSMHNVTNYFITNLAIVDIIISVFSTPFQFQAAILQEWPWLPILCKLGPFSTTLNINISVLTLVALSLDRFYVIYYPLRPKLRPKHCLVIIVFIWLGSLLLSSYQFLNYHVVKYTDYHDVAASNTTSSNNKSSYEYYQCENGDKNYSVYHLTVLFVIQFLFPFVILWFTFLAISYKIYIKADEKKILSNKQNHINRRKVIKMILIVLFCFIVCWTPIQFYNLLSIIKPEINTHYYINLIWLISNMFAMSNSCYNVLIYGFCSTRFRREFVRIYRKLTCKKQRILLRSRSSHQQHGGATNSTTCSLMKNTASFQNTFVVATFDTTQVRLIQSTQNNQPKTYSANSFS